MTTMAMKNLRAELIKAETALKSFRDAGYNLGDAVAESIDNSLQAGAKRVSLDWKTRDVQEGRSKKTRTEVDSFAVADDGSGIPANILHNVLTVGFSTRYGSREGIGRFGVGFKLASISQARRLEVYTRPSYLSASENRTEARATWTPADENCEGKVFMTHLDLDEIEAGEQQFYGVEEVDDFPPEYRHLMDGFKHGTLIVWRKTDRLNAVGKSYKVRVDEKLKNLTPFLSRAYRVYIDRGLEIYVNGSEEPLLPYDPTFTIENPLANQLGDGEDMRGEPVESGTIEIDGHKVNWRVTLTPAVTRRAEGGGGVKGPKGDRQFEKLRIDEDSAGKISFLRHGREISYAVVPKLIKPDKSGEGKIDRYIGMEVAFPPALDEYFQVKHIKRGAEPVEKLREELKKALEKPVKTARERIRALWAETKKAEPKKSPDDVSGGRAGVENLAQSVEPGMPTGMGGQGVTPAEEVKALLQAAEEVGIKDEEKKKEFVTNARQKPVIAIDTQWPGKGLLDIEHLTHTVVVRINRKHPFIQQIYLPLREAADRQGEGLDADAIGRLCQSAVDGMDLMLFAYAKAENQSKTPDDDYSVLREDWGKFAAVYLRRRDEVSVG